MKLLPYQSKGLKWILFWVAFLGLLILADTFVFLPLDVPRASIQQPSDHFPEDKVLEVSWLGPPNFAVGKEGLWIERMLEDRFHLDLTPILLDPNAYQRKKPLMLAGGPVPDLVWEADPISLQMAVKHKFVAELPLEMIRQYMPQYFEDLTKEAPVAWLYSTVDGRNYGIPTLNRPGAQPSNPGVWRMDWLRNVGIEKVPETLEEFHNALSRFRHEDPDRNGVKDTYGMSGDVSNWWWTAFTEIFGAFGVTPFDWQEVDGAIVWGGTRPETKEALSLLHQWYQEDLIHPDFVTDSAAAGQSIEQKFYAGKIGYLNYKGNYSDMSRYISGTFGNNFLNLRLEEILQNQSTVADAFLASIENALLEHVATSYVDHLLADPALDSISVRINNTVRYWIKEAFIFGRFSTVTASIPSGGTPSRQIITETALTEAFSFERLRDYLDSRIGTTFSQERLDDFRRSWRSSMGELDASTAIADLLEGRLDGIAETSLRELAAAAGLSRALDERSLYDIVRSYFFRQLDQGTVPRILVPGRPPVGPEGKRGARAWGKPGNILAFGRQVAEQPEKAIRIMKMLEAMHTDIDLYWMTRMGEEGTHWEWWNPIQKEKGGRGFTLKPDFKDPVSGDTIDLQVVKNAKRQMLHPSLGFYNLVAGKPHFADYEEQRKFAFERKYMKEEWGIVNPLGKSDVVPSASVYLGDLRMRQQTFFAEVIRGSRPVSDFDEFVATWRKTGGDVLLEEANRMFADWKLLKAELERHLEN